MPNLVKGTAVNVVGLGQAAKVTHAGASGTIYVGDGQVSSTTYDTSVTTGDTVIVQGPAWIIGSLGDLGIPYLLADYSSARAGAAPETRHWVGGAAQKVANGTNKTPVAATVYTGTVNITNRCLLTGAGYLVGGTGGTDKAIVILYDSTGHVLAYSDKTGTTVGSSDTYQQIAFTTKYEVLQPGRYFLGVVYNGNTARVEVNDGAAGPLGATTTIGGAVASAADFTNAPINITAPTAVAANIPFMYTY